MRKRSKTAMKREADTLFSRLVRSRGVCEAAFSPHLSGCSGPLQCAHIVSRRYLSVRWSGDNAIAACSRHHVYYTHHPLEWAVFIGGLIGAEKFEELQQRALAGRGAPDYESVLERLKAAA